MHKVGQGLALDHTPILQAGNGIVAQLQRLFSQPQRTSLQIVKNQTGFARGCRPVSSRVEPSIACHPAPPEPELQAAQPARRPCATPAAIGSMWGIVSSFPAP